MNCQAEVGEGVGEVEGVTVEVIDDVIDEEEVPPPPP